jgi:hypothetical protein
LLLERFKDSLRSKERPPDPEADVDGSKAGLLQASGRAKDLWIVRPGTAADDAFTDDTCTDNVFTTFAISAFGPRRAVLRCPLIICVIRILHPLPDVTVHVIEPKLICRKRADRRRLLVVPSAAATIAVGVVFANLVTPSIGRLRSPARRIFELGLGEQPVRLASHPRQPYGVMPGIIPCDVCDRLSAAPVGAVAHVRAAAIRHAGVPVTECDIELGYRKWPGEYDLDVIRKMPGVVERIREEARSLRLVR